MNLWEKTLVNLNKGYERLTLFAATFSERVRAEINIVRLRMQKDELEEAIDEEVRLIGGRLIVLRNKGTLPATMDQFLANDEIVASLEKISLHEKTLDDLREELGREAAAIRRDRRKKEGERPA